MTTFRVNVHGTAVTAFRSFLYQTYARDHIQISLLILNEFKQIN